MGVGQVAGRGVWTHTLAGSGWLYLCDSCKEGKKRATMLGTLIYRNSETKVPSKVKLNSDFMRRHRFLAICFYEGFFVCVCFYFCPCSVFPCSFSKNTYNYLFIYSVDPSFAWINTISGLSKNMTLEIYTVIGNHETHLNHGLNMYVFKGSWFSKWKV